MSKLLPATFGDSKHAIRPSPLVLLCVTFPAIAGGLLLSIDDIVLFCEDCESVVFCLLLFCSLQVFLVSALCSVLELH